MNAIQSLELFHSKRIAHIDDEREIGNSIIVTLQKHYTFADEPGCGVRGFDTLKELKEGIKAKNIVFQYTPGA
jgi:hypothetical protein